MSIFNNLNNLNTLNYSSSRYNDVIYRTESSASLDLNFARNKSLIDSISGNNLITFTRASSGTFVGDDGLIQTATTDVPRFDHNPTTGESLGLLVEAQNTNLLLQSEDFSTTWTNVGSSENTNVAVAPNGTQTADALVDTAISETHIFDQTVSGLAGSTAHTFSCFMKKGSKNYGVLVFTPNSSWSAGSGASVFFDLNNGTVTTSAGATGTIQALPNGWYRCTATATTVSSPGTVTMKVGSSLTGTAQTYTGSGDEAIYLWGAQLEVGAFPTSYIPTTTATVTRSADVASITGTNFSSWYNQTQGTMFAHAKREFAVPSGSFSRVWQLQGALNSNRIELSYFSGGQASFISTSEGVQFQWYPSVFIQNGIKSAQAINQNNVAAASNGLVSATDTSVTLPTVQEIRIGTDGTAVNTLNGTISRLTYFPTRLSNTTLQNITR
jgi:hypothetical protein